MKKLLTLFAAVSLAASMVAQNAVNDTVKQVAAQEMTTNPGVAAIAWEADSTISQGYYIVLGTVDMSAKTVQTFARLASTAKNFGLGPSYPNMFGITSDQVLKYGTNYTKATGLTEAESAQWEAAWNASVDTTDYTLAAGYYQVIVFGISVSGESMYVTEAANGYVFKMDGKSVEAVENVFESTKPVKFIAPDGQVRILRDSKIYTLSGMLVQ